MPRTIGPHRQALQPDLQGIMDQPEPHFPFVADRHCNMDGSRRTIANFGSDGPFNFVGQVCPKRSSGASELSEAGALHGADALRGLREWQQRNRRSFREERASPSVRLLNGHASLDALDALGGRPPLESTSDIYGSFEDLTFSGACGKYNNHGLLEPYKPSRAYSVPRTIHTCMGIRCEHPMEDRLTP